MWSNCWVCGSKMHKRRRNSTAVNEADRDKNVRRYTTCSQLCADTRSLILHKKLRECWVCGGPKSSPDSRTCSPECKEKRRLAKLLTPKNLCRYTALKMEEYENMLDILHRKGYSRANGCEEKWTYQTEGFPEIKWRDIMARGTLLPRKASASKEQQRHEDGVQQEARSPSASAHSIEEL